MTQPHDAAPPANPPGEPWYRQATPWVVAALTLVLGAFGGFVVGQNTGSKSQATPVGPASASPTADAEGSASANPPASSPAAPAAEAIPPQGATETMGIALGQDLTPGGKTAADAVTVEVVYDYLCPFCKQFEDTQGKALRELVKQGQVQLVIHPVAILDRMSTTGYSSRAATAAVAVAALAPKQFYDFDQALWANQPAEGGPGLSDEEMADLAKKVGVPNDVVAQLSGSGYAAWSANATQTMSQVQGFQGTPWVLMSYNNGDRYQVDWSKVNWTQAAANVKAGKSPQE